MWGFNPQDRGSNPRGGDFFNHLKILQIGTIFPLNFQNLQSGAHWHYYSIMKR